MTSPDRPRPWAPSLSSLRVLGGGRSVALLRPDAEILWWCAPDVDDAPLCWRLLDPDGGTARFPDLDHADVDAAPAGASASTLLRDDVGLVEVYDGLLPRGDGVVLIRLMRRRAGSGPITHELRLGGFDTPAVTWQLADGLARGTHPTREVLVRGGRHETRDGVLVTHLEVDDRGWNVLAVGVGAEPIGTAEQLHSELVAVDVAARRRLGSARLPRTHPGRALDALTVIRACTYARTGAVVASPTTSLPEAPGHDRQFDYRYTWLRDASLSTAVAALLGQRGDARRYLDFVHAAWGDVDLLTRPVLTVHGEPVPDEREVGGVQGWADSLPVRVGNGANGQRQYDALGLFAEAVSVFVQVGGRLDADTWSLIRRLADDIAGDDPGSAKQSNGIWELRTTAPLVDGDLGRWLLLDRALWIARGWRPWTRRSHWKAARDTIRQRVLAAIDDDGLLPQAYGQDPPLPDASALMAVAFGLLDADDPRAGALVDALIDRLGAGPYLYRYPPGGDDGFTGVEGAFLPMSFLAVTALAQLGRVEQAERRLDRLCATLPRLLAEEVDPQTGEMLGNTPLVWSHAELARAVYVLDAAKRRQRWGSAGLWAWRLQRYLRLRSDRGSHPRQASQEDAMQTRQRPAGPPAGTMPQ